MSELTWIQVPCVLTHSWVIMTESVKITQLSQIDTDQFSRQPDPEMGQAPCDLESGLVLTWEFLECSYLIVINVIVQSKRGWLSPLLSLDSTRESSAEPHQLNPSCPCFNAI